MRERAQKRANQADAPWLVVEIEDGTPSIIAESYLEKARESAGARGHTITVTERVEPDPFGAWVCKVDRIVQSICGIGERDGSDWPSRDLFDSGCTPEQGALGWAEAQDLLPEELLEAFMVQAD